MAGNRLVVRFSDGSAETLVSGSSFAARQAFESVIRSLDITGRDVKTTTYGRPRRLRATLTESAAVDAPSDGDIARVDLWQRGRDLPPAPDKAGEFLRDPAFDAASQVRAQAELAVGIAQVCLLGGQDLIERCFPGVVMDGGFSEAVLANADRQSFTLAASVMDVVRVALGNDMPDRVAAVERARHSRVFGASADNGPGEST